MLLQRFLNSIGTLGEREQKLTHFSKPDRKRPDKVQPGLFAPPLRHGVLRHRVLAHHPRDGGEEQVRSVGKPAHPLQLVERRDPLHGLVPRVQDRVGWDVFREVELGAGDG